MHKMGLYEKYIKRPQDFSCALAGLALLSPVMAITAILVRIFLGSPVLFSQERVGRNEKVFRIYKFRTMTSAVDENGNLLSDDKRLTRFGKSLRASSLYELPELFNILKGDMAVIGPRPLLVLYLPFYTPDQRRRHEVRPGLSGLAQISGRNAVSWEYRLKKDLEYVDHVTFTGDWKIIFITILKIWKREGIHSETSATMEMFQGEKDK